MEIDWITVAAQIVNFLVLVWLLQHFLYGPIIRAMDRREKRIADRLRDAAQREDEAETEARKYREKQEELDSRRDRMLADAREQADEQRKEMEHAAREDVESRKQEWLKDLRAQQQTFLRDIAEQTADRFHSLSRQALADLADADLEGRMVNAFLARLKDVDKETRKRIVKACREDEATIIVSSRFELPANERRRITKAIHDDLAEGTEVEYRSSDEILCGIELKAGSQRLSWSIDGYIESLQAGLAEQLSKVTQEDEKKAAQ